MVIKLNNTNTPYQIDIRVLINLKIQTMSSDNAILLNNAILNNNLYQMLTSNIKLDSFNNKNDDYFLRPMLHKI